MLGRDDVKCPAGEFGQLDDGELFGDDVSGVLLECSARTGNIGGDRGDRDVGDLGDVSDPPCLPNAAKLALLPSVDALFKLDLLNTAPLLLLLSTESRLRFCFFLRAILLDEGFLRRPHVWIVVLSRGKAWMTTCLSLLMMSSTISRWINPSTGELLM